MFARNLDVEIQQIAPRSDGGSILGIIGHRWTTLVAFQFVRIQARPSWQFDGKFVGQNFKVLGRNAMGTALGTKNKEKGED